MPAQRFPLFRKTPDGRHFYRIESDTGFTEIQKVGSRHAVHRVEARAYPELVRIAEMIDGAGGRFVHMEPTEWDVLYARI
ncbi:MAG: hypothetical protein IPL52_09860 [Flavobacteriales bacterium]|nr:hypothetical protein [Flavobacteriales bacterium]